MDKRAQIAQKFKDLTQGQTEGLTVFSAKVLSVEGNTCTVDYDGLSVSDVRLNPTTTSDDNKILLTPAVDSYVLIASLTGDLASLSVLTADTLTSVEIVSDEISVFIDKEGVIFNGGELGGMVKLNEVTKKLNALENQFNQLKNMLKSWTPSPNDGGAALKGLVSTWAGQPIIATKAGELENEKVKQ